MPVYDRPGTGTVRRLNEKPMQSLRFPVDVVMERVPLDNRWASEFWRPAAVEPCDGGDDDKFDAEQLRDDAAGTLWRLGPYSIELHPTEAEGYFLNVTSPAPCVFVMWRPSDDTVPPARPVLVTVSYNEAGRLLDGGERVDNVAMPAAILDWIRPFVALHYKPEPKRKMKRNDPLANGGNVRDGDRRD
jgi:hypothetical protein